MAHSLDWKLQKEENYKEFYKEGAGLSTSFDRDAQRKKELLIKYFPYRFGQGGKQDLRARGYDNLQIGSIFSYLINYAKKYAK